LEQDSPVVVGREDTSHRHSGGNAYFDCKVLSKRHAELEWRAGRVWLRDCGSSNGTFLNLARLSRAGEGSQARPVRSGDSVQLGTAVGGIQPVLLTLQIQPALQQHPGRPVSGSEYSSQEDVTVTEEAGPGPHFGDESDSFQHCSVSRDSLLLLKEKLVEMEKGMEFLSFKERDYEELQLLAEEQAETICDLEKENYKLKTAMDNIERKIDFEKQKYMKLAEYEAETICNLEKENFKLIDTLNSVEENLLKEKEKNNQLTAIHEAERRELATVQTGLANRTAELLQAQELKVQTNHILQTLQEENLNMKLQEKFSEATEADLDLLMYTNNHKSEASQDELETLTESRRNSINTLSSTVQVVPGVRAILSPDPALIIIVAFIAFLLGFTLNNT